MAPPSVEIVCADAGGSNAYEGAVPANLLLCCGVFGNVSDAHDQREGEQGFGSWQAEAEIEIRQAFESEDFGAELPPYTRRGSRRPARARRLSKR